MRARGSRPSAIAPTESGPALTNSDRSVPRVTRNLQQARCHARQRLHEYC